MKKNGKVKTWEDVLDEGIKTYIDEFEKRMVNDTNPVELITIELNNINYQLTQQHNSNPKFNEIFFELQERAKRNKNLTLLQLCHQYCLEKKIPLNSGELFFVGLLKLYNIRMWFIKRHSELNAFNTPPKDSSQETFTEKKNSFTTARKILALSYLLETSYETELAESRPDKTEIARFIELLISNNKPSKKIIDSYTYAKVKVLFGRPDEAETVDLIVLQDEFRKIGLTVIADKIKSEISKKKKRVQ